MHVEELNNMYYYLVIIVVVEMLIEPGETSIWEINLADALFAYDSTFQFKVDLITGQP